MAAFFLLLALIGSVAGPSRAVAAPIQDPKLLADAPQVADVVGKKEFFVNYALGSNPWREYQVFVVVRPVPDPLRKGWYELEFVGRAAVAESTVTSARLVLYKPFKGGELQKGDRLVQTGDPLTLEEMDLMHREVLGVLKMDKELEDLYSGVISLKAGVYNGRLRSTSLLNGQTLDTNAFKRSDSFVLKSLGMRWWFFFNPAFGVNFDWSGGSIPTTGFRYEPETSTQSYYNPGLVYRGRLLIVPAIYSITYFINSFKTTNPDDFLISSTYSGVNFSMTFYWPYRVNLLRLGPVLLAFNNIEAGGGFAPAVSVSDEKFKRGASGGGNQLSANAALEFNLSIRGLKFTNDLFFIFEGGLQRYSLSFSGPTEGKLPDGSNIPEGGSHTEMQTWYGLRLKYNIRDVVGELLYGL